MLSRTSGSTEETCCGEYANVNDQDKTALAEIGPDHVITYRLGATDQELAAQPGLRSLALNFFEGYHAPDAGQDYAPAIHRDLVAGKIVIVDLARGSEGVLQFASERHSMGSFEAQHDYWRDRYRVGADTLANRPKAIGIGWYRLRALTACLVEWLRICFREGWLGSARRNSRTPVRRGQMIGINNARSLVRSRVVGGLMAAYGPAAAALGLGAAEPPSRRRPPDRT